MIPNDEFPHTWYLVDCLALASQRSDSLRRCRNRSDRISTYGRKVHQQYPTGDVVVSERDLAEQLRKRPDTVATALNLLLGEQKVQKAPLSGYWKLNV